MATITTKAIIKEILDNEGVFPGDPQVHSIWEYRHAATGKIMWAIFYNPAHFDLDVSPYVAEYSCLWTREEGHVAQLGILEQEVTRGQLG